jgi:hypothetical protein
MIFMLLAVGAGCTASDPERRHSEVVVTDSAGITIIDNGALPPPDEPDGPLSPSLRIGVVEGDAEYQLFRVMAVKRLSDGAVVVSNGGSREIRIYEPDGSHRATAGGGGQGPGEFRFPSGLVILPGDTIQVQDFLDRSYFAPDGAFLRQETGNRQAVVDLAESRGRFSEGGAWLADGTYFAPLLERGDPSPRAGPPFRPAMTLARMTSDLGEAEILGDFGGIHQQFIEVGGPFGVTATVPPFAPRTSWALGAGDGTIVVGDNATPQVDRFHPDGSRSIVRWSAEVRPVMPRDVEAWKDRQRSASWAQSRLSELERAWAVMEVPETRPHYGRIAAGSDGTLWVTAEPPGERTTVHVFGPDGRFRRTVRFPGDFSVHDSGAGWVLGVTRDEHEVEFVHMFEFLEVC